MKLALALLALTLPAANAVEYSWTKGTEICAGIIVPCSDLDCSATAVGPCPGEEKKPTAWLETAFQGLAYVDSEKYLDVKTGKVSLDDTTYKIIEATGPGFRDYNDEVKSADLDSSDSDASDSDDGKFAFSMVGNVFGDTETAGGYVGLVSFLNTGTTTLKTNYVPVFSAESGSKQTPRDDAWSDSDIGAPFGPYFACISEISADKKCGAERSIKPDDYQFSIFGGVAGKDYDTEVQKGVDGFPAGMDKMGVRIQLKATGFAVTDLKVNGKSWAPSMVNEDVNSLSIMHESGGLNYEFPKKYNTGDAKDAEEDKDLPNTGTHDMAIRISTIDEEKQTIMIDYLFDTSKLSADTWFIYAPDVTAVPVPSSNPTISAAPSSINDSKSSATTTVKGSFFLITTVVAIMNLAN